MRAFRCERTRALLITLKPSAPVHARTLVHVCINIVHLSHSLSLARKKPPKNARKHTSLTVVFPRRTGLHTAPSTVIVREAAAAA